MDVLHVVVRVRCHLGQTRHAAGNGVDVREIEVNLALLCGSENVQHGVGGTAHGNVERHCVDKGIAVGDVARQHGLVTIVVVALRQVHNQFTGAGEQIATGLLSRQGRTVARQGQAEGLGQAVHRVCGEHTRARSAGRARRALDVEQVLVIDLVVRGCRNS